MLVAFASVAVVIAVVVAVLVSSTPNDPTVKSTDPAYAYLPTTLPADMQPAAQLVASQSALSSLRGVRYVSAAGRRASVSVITSRGASLNELGFPPGGRHFSVHGHDAQLVQANVPVPPLTFALVWEDRGVTIQVRATGLRVSEMLKIARSTGRADASRFARATKGLPTIDLTREMFDGSALTPTKGEIELAVYDTSDGPGRVILRRRDVEGLDWLCVDYMVRLSTGARGGSGDCVDPAKGFDFPTEVYDLPNQFFLGSFAAGVESVELLTDDGNEYTAALHDTHAGQRPLVAIVTKGYGRRSFVPNATVVVKDASGRVLSTRRVAI
jgi:hypothetical protein